MPLNQSLHAWLSLLQNEAGKRGIRLYLVGGFLRDLFLGIPGKDLDLAGSTGVLELADELARIHSLSRQVVAHYRLVRIHIAGHRLDITVLEGDDLWRDLRARDFSINAMALPLAAFLRSGRRALPQLIDPSGGLDDVRKRILRAMPQALQSDPVRILRCARLASLYSLRPAETTLIEARQAARGLQSCARERIAGEVLAAFSVSAEGYLPRLHDLGALEPLFGRSTTAENTTLRLELLLSNSFFPRPMYKALVQYMEQPVTVPHNRLRLLRLAALTTDMAEPGSAPQCPWFLAAAREKAACDKTLAALAWLRQEPQPHTRAALYEYYLNFPLFGPEGVLLWCAAMGPGSTETALIYLSAYLKNSRLVVPPQILTGREVAAKTGKRRLPVTVITEAQLHIRRAAALGVIRSRQQAIAHLEGFLDGKSRNCLSKRNKKGRNGKEQVE